MAHIVNLDQNAINSLLQAHNNFRSGRGLPALKWNSQIANQAAGWVGNSMKYENMMAQPNPHGQTQGVGQNIAWNFQSIPFPSSDSQLPYSGLVKLWNDETVPMQPGTYNHVSQVLWGSTTDVGCSVGVGPNPKTPSNTAYNYNVILVCDYFPQETCSQCLPRGKENATTKVEPKHRKSGCIILVGRWNSENIPTTPGTYNQATQVLWGSTTEVRCAVVVGPNPKPVSNSIYNNDLILVCDYYPPGNIVGKQWNTVSSQPYYG
ncbi:PR-1-like protein [Rhizoclosmatium globosum]|uniref:PR-1-like protein n=1 Tax=Rhizoclosmatium globosum TaxID=329046 RepID=A0A1Y2CTX8_9FUNG|nr:PR-1-like protein [Rhizoclosmatium globosum]|eukprot:ORY50442.1 PR-1-like protein [Rhizoclosmatium globosum]